MKYIQASMITCLCATMLIVSGTQFAEAVYLKKSVEPKASKAFGMKTIYKVCGDTLCSKNSITTETSKGITTKESTNGLQNELIKIESTKTDKKSEAINTALKFWEQYYKQSAPIKK